MKRGVIFLSFTFFISIILSSCSLLLSEEEQQKRAEDYSLLVDTLQAVGYDNDFKSLKEKNSIEQNLRILWEEYLSHPLFAARDVRKNIELLISLGNFDFIAEGLKSKASSDNPYYNDWPRDSRYNISSRTVYFRDDEVLWLMLLLPDSDFPEEHFGLKEVLAECGENVLGQGLLGPETSEGIWFYYEKTSPGLLEKVNRNFLNYFSNEIKTAFNNADEDIQNRFMQAIDVKRFRDIYYADSPSRVFSFDEAEELMREFPPTGSWAGGYIRVIGYDHTKHDINTSVYGAYAYARLSDALVPVINPADARFAVYEEYTDGKHYASYYTYANDPDTYIEVYLMNLNISIVDLLTGEIIFSESVISDPPPEEISNTIYNYWGSSLKIVDGEYYHADFDYGKYAALMEEHCETSASSIQRGL